MREHLVSFSSIPLRLRNTYLAFLAKNGLTDEGDCDFTAMLLDDLDNILACGSLRGNVLKQIAVAPSAEGSGYCAQIISALVAESFERGAAHQFLYTKPMHRNIFRSMGFYPIVETNEVLMMENRPRGIQTFLKSLPHPSGKVGAVVCNCNPFTLGHRHLIEQASHSCDAVLVFVLSEDASLFSAADRFELVRAGTADLKNVYVVRSEEYMVSRATFPMYFLKESIDAQKVRCDLDLLLFGKRIAPALNISVRFVGEEPFDPVTNLYNQRMKALLPPLGIEVVEIPRYQDISASYVRKLLQEGRVLDTQTMLPMTTYDYCLCHFGRNAAGQR